MVYKYQSRMTPTLVIGDKVIIGFDPEQLDKVIA